MLLLLGCAENFILSLPFYRWLLFGGLDYWTEIFLVFTHVVVSLIDSYG